LFVFGVGGLFLLEERLNFIELSLQFFSLLLLLRKNV
jgi:hypothetical protein